MDTYAATGQATPRNDMLILSGSLLRYVISLNFAVRPHEKHRLFDWGCLLSSALRCCFAPHGNPGSEGVFTFGSASRANAP